MRRKHLLENNSDSSNKARLEASRHLRTTKENLKAEIGELETNSKIKIGASVTLRRISSLELI